MWPNTYCGMMPDTSRAGQVIYNNPLQQISSEFVLSRQPCSYERFRRRPMSQRPNHQSSYRAAVNPSKRHRDRLNQELDTLAKLLPFPEEVISRLDKLSVLRLCVGYLRNKNFFKDVSKKTTQTQEFLPPLALENTKGIFSQLFNEAVDGFMLVLTYTGVIFYISESVKSHLGYSQSQYLHQSMFSYIHDDDHDELRAGLEQIQNRKIVELDDEGNNMEIGKSEGEKPREFLLRMKSVLNSSSSDMYKPYKVTGYMRRLNFNIGGENDGQYGLFATCTPARPSCSMLEMRIKSTLFCSKNRLDLTFLDLDARGKDFFGYSKKDIFGRSSYVMVHRADLQHLRCKHTEIINRGRTTMAAFRLLCKSNDWTWICGYARVIYKNHKEDFVVTTNRLMSEEEGDAILKIRDAEDVKSLQRLGLGRNEILEEEAMKLGFPLSNNFDMSAIDTGPMPTFHGNSDAVIAGSINDQHHTSITDDLLQENPEELFDVSEELLKSSPENILDSPEDFSDAFDMSPETLIKDPIYQFSMGHENGAPTTCASVRSDSISTVSDVSMEQHLMQYQRQQSAGSSASPIRPDGSFDHTAVDAHKLNSLSHLAKSLHDLDVNVPPNVLAPMTDANSLLNGMAVLDNFMQSSAMQSVPARHVTPPQNQGRSLTDLSSPLPQQNGYPMYDSYIQNKPFFAQPQPDYRPPEFKPPMISERSVTRPNTIQYTNNAMQAPSTFPNNYANEMAKQSQSSLQFSQLNMERPPNVTITVPEYNVEEIRTSLTANGRSESSPKYPFLSQQSPTISWSNSLGHANGNMESVEQMNIQNFNDLQQSQQQIYHMTRLLNQQQQQQPRANGFPPQYYSNELAQQQFRDSAAQQGHR